MNRRPTKSTLFPYTALFRSGRQPHRDAVRSRADVDVVAQLAGQPHAHAAAGQVVAVGPGVAGERVVRARDRKSTRLNSSHAQTSYAVFSLQKDHRILVTCAG